MDIVYPSGYKVVTLAANDKLALTSYDIAQISQLITNPNQPDSWSVLHITQPGDTYVTSAFASGARLQINAFAAPIFYDVGSDAAIPTLDSLEAQIVDINGDIVQINIAIDTINEELADLDTPTTVVGTPAGAGTGNGGNADVTGGSGGQTAGTGGDATLIGGAALAGNSVGGRAIIAGGIGSGTSAGGVVTIDGGEAGANGIGGSITIKPGASHGANNGVALNLLGGLGGSVSGNGGTINITAGAALATGEGGNLILSGGLGNGGANPGRIVKRSLELHNQPAPAAKTTSVTLTAAEVINGIITVNEGATATSELTLPLASGLDTVLTVAENNDAFNFSVINISTNTLENATVLTNTGWTLVGNMDIAANSAITTKSSANFKARRTGMAAWTLYRMS